MKKFISYILFIFICNILFTINIFANITIEENLGDNIFKITSCNLTESKEDTCVTFDKYKTIIGIAKEGSTIKIVNNILVNGEYVNFQEYEFIVGQSCIFSKDINLELGYNNVQISGTINKKTESKKYLIKKLSKDIKQEMEYNIILPTDRLNCQSK